MSQTKKETPAVQAAPEAAAPAPVLLIRKNDFLSIIDDPENPGKKKLFGKVGYQTMGSHCDDFTLLNMEAIARTMAAGELTDENGKQAYNHAVIRCYCRIDLVKPENAIQQVATIQALGTEVKVPDAPVVVPGTQANPFEAA